MDEKTPRRVLGREKGSVERFDECCSHRPVASLPFGAVFDARETAHRAVATDRPPLGKARFIVIRLGN